VGRTSDFVFFRPLCAELLEGLEEVVFFHYLRVGKSKRGTRSERLDQRR
jgi:hypothetical protein